MTTQPDTQHGHPKITRGGEQEDHEASRSEGLSFPPGHRPARVCVKLSKDGGTLARTYGVVLPLRGFAIAPTPSEADVVVTDTVQIAQTMLAAGHRVIHLASEKVRSGFERPSAGLMSHPEFGPRYRCVDPLHLVALYGALSEIEGPVSEQAPEAGTSLDLGSILTKSTLRGLHILVVDNHELNRASAAYQFGDGNELSVCETYKEGVELLRSRPFDVALLDLLMPPESFTLSGAAFEKVVGSEFPAGIFAALVAARAGVREVRIITDASHHDHPATALIDFIAWGTEIPCGAASRITFEKARTVQIPRSTGRINDSVKDWASTLEGRPLFGTERTAHQHHE